jgi:site-specific recombinase XerD
MLKIIFYIKSDKVNVAGQSPIYAKIKLNQETTTISTGKSISAERWKATNNLRNLLRQDREKVIKESLVLFMQRAERFYIEMDKEGGPCDLETLKNKILGKTEEGKKILLLPLFDLHNQHFLKLVGAGERSKASYQKYLRSKELVRLFIKRKYGKEDIETKEISSSFIYNLESFLKFESSYKDKVGIKNNSVVKYFRNIKTVCNYAIKMDVLEKNPFAKYDGKVTTIEAVFLSQEELAIIQQKTFVVERLQKVKDIFLFSCYTGYAPVDACRLTSENIIADNNGNLWLKTLRQKTGIKANVPILPPVLAIINKYQFIEKGLLPKISNQKMNAYLKEIADILGINKNLTWYTARHTFATTVTLGNGIKIENVSAMLGHTNIKQTQHYAKVLDMNVGEDMQKLKDKYT